MRCYRQIHVSISDLSIITSSESDHWRNRSGRKISRPQVGSIGMDKPQVGRLIYFSRRAILSGTRIFRKCNRVGPRYSRTVVIIGWDRVYGNPDGRGLCPSYSLHFLDNSSVNIVDIYNLCTNQVGEHIVASYNCSAMAVMGCYNTTYSRQKGSKRIRHDGELKISK